MRYFNYCIGVILLLIGVNVRAQQSSINLTIEELTGTQLPEVHSFACAQWQGKWLFIGGRTNGLHGFLPPLAFPNNGRNTDIILYDHIQDARIDQPVAGLPDSIREAITTSNMQFYQADSILYMIGGYGWNASQSTFITYPTLTAVNVPGLIHAMQNSLPIASFFRQVRHDSFAVCGAHLGKIGNAYQLAFGHRFDGIYDRHDTTGFHVQQYTYAIRRFEINDNGQQIQVQWLPAEIDSTHFRRRDYNLVPQIFPDGQRGYTAFSGVFQRGVNLPYLYPMDIYADSVRVRLSTQHMLANYHCAVIPLYDSVANQMHTMFFGGEAMYAYDSTGNLYMDTLVPFVNTISYMTRESNGQMTEYVVDTTLPALIGSNAQFFPIGGQPWLEAEGIIRLDKITQRTLVGFIVGGIESPFPNISDTDPAQSFASPRVIAIYLDGSGVNSISPAGLPFSAQIYPNPITDQAKISIDNTSNQPVQIGLRDVTGRWLGTQGLPFEVNQGEYIWKPKLPAGHYYLVLRQGGLSLTKHLIVLEGR